jgi:hypothetical protein
MHLFKECLRMEAICRELAQREPDKREEWRARARLWHQRAGYFVTAVFGDVPLPPSKKESLTVQDTSEGPLVGRH